MTKEFETYGALEGFVHVSLTPEEIGALDALKGYGTQSFLDFFYKHMGKAYLYPYEKGLRSLFEKVDAMTVSADHIRRSRRVFSGELVSIEPRELERLKSRSLELHEIEKTRPSRQMQEGDL